MPDWFPWALLVATYLLAGATAARLLVMLDEMAGGAAPALGKVYRPGVMRKTWPLLALFWPFVLWATL